MPLHRCDVTIPMFTGVPSDVVQNTFHFRSNVELANPWNVIQTRLNTFYNSVYGANTVRVNYMDWNAITIKIFDLADTPPRIPVMRAVTFAGAGTATTKVATEVACVLSWHAAPMSGVRYQRLYNRIFLGAVGDAWMQNSAVDAFPTFAPAQITIVKNAALALLAADDTDLVWRQVSRAPDEPGGEPTNPLDRDVTGGWVDNSPDTQRRRSVLASTRNIW